MLRAILFQGSGDVVETAFNAWQEENDGKVRLDRVGFSSCAEVYEVYKEVTIIVHSILVLYEDIPPERWSEKTKEKEALK